MLSSLPRRNNSPLAQCGCKKHAMVSTIRYEEVHKKTQVPRLPYAVPHVPIRSRVLFCGHAAVRQANHVYLSLDMTGLRLAYLLRCRGY